MKNCETCNQEFKPKSKEARFCSRKCSSASRKRDRICEQCGLHFWPRPDSGRGQNAQKYCSTRCRGNARKKVRICQWCSKEFTRVNQGQPKYCSSACFEMGRRKGRNLQTYTCYGCGKEFERYPSTVRNPDRVYCRRECFTPTRKYKRGIEHPQYKNGQYSNNGHIYEKDYDIIVIDGNFGYKTQHIRIMEEHLGRKLIEGEHVHHLNMNKSDNRIENLIVLTNSQHRTVHHFYELQFCKEHDAAGDLREITINFIESLEED